MKSIKARYISIREELPLKYSSYVCFARAIFEQKFRYKMISRWFNLLVDKEDYLQKERKAIVKYLHYLSNLPEEGEFKGRNRRQGR